MHSRVSDADVRIQHKSNSATRGTGEAAMEWRSIVLQIGIYQRLCRYRHESFLHAALLPDQLVARHILPALVHVGVDCAGGRSDIVSTDIQLAVWLNAFHSLHRHRQ